MLRYLNIPLLATAFAVPNAHALDSAPAAFLNKLRSFAGANARDCGFVRLVDDHAAAVACARDATSAGKAYALAIQFQGVDSLVWQGAARDEHGKLWVLYYDSDPAGGGATPTLSAVPCQEIRFEVQGGDVIDCQPISGAR